MYIVRCLQIQVTVIKHRYQLENVFEILFRHLLKQIGLDRFGLDC